MKKQDIEYFMKIAIAKAKQGIRRGQTPFGAVIVLMGKIIGAAHNHVWKRYDSTAHAEIMALRMAEKKLKTIHLPHAVMISTCEPCPMCLAACHWARISEIVYGATIADAAEYGFNELKISNLQMLRLGNPKIKLVQEILRPSCQELFRIWKTARQSEKY